MIKEYKGLDHKITIDDMLCDRLAVIVGQNNGSESKKIILRTKIYSDGIMFSYEVFRNGDIVRTTIDINDAIATYNKIN